MNGTSVYSISSGISVHDISDDGGIPLHGIAVCGISVCGISGDWGISVLSISVHATTVHGISGDGAISVHGIISDANGCELDDNCDNAIGEVSSKHDRSVWVPTDWQVVFNGRSASESSICICFFDV